MELRVKSCLVFLENSCLKDSQRIKVPHSKHQLPLKPQIVLIIPIDLYSLRTDSFLGTIGMCLRGE